MSIHLKALELKRNIIKDLNAKKLDEYFKKYKNTICGRNSISVLLCMIEQYKEEFKEKEVMFDCAGYTQSNKVKDMEGSSVSYELLLII